jgi:biotin carboxyl carrier protein
MAVRGSIGPPGDDRLRLTVDGPEPLTAELAPAEGEALGPSTPEVRPLPVGPADVAAGILRAEVTVGGWVLTVRVESAARAALRERASESSSRAVHRDDAVIRARIPGRVVRVWVAVGDEVGAGERLLAIEAMKMENEVRAPKAGIVRSLSAAVGAAVELGDELVTIG